MKKANLWRKFDRMSIVLESISYLIVIFGPLLGIAMLILGGSAIRFAGLILLLVSILFALYHYSFSLLMRAVKEISNRLDSLRGPDPDS